MPNLSDFQSALGRFACTRVTPPACAVVCRDVRRALIVGVAAFPYAVAESPAKNPTGKVCSTAARSKAGRKLRSAARVTSWSKTLGSQCSPETP